MQKKTQPITKGFFDNEDVRNELNGLSDRACLIVGASIVDELLGRLLSCYLIGNKKKILKEFMEGGNAALGSFSNKSKACYLLGLISADVFEDIQLIRTMRNDAAHKLATISFEETDFKNKVYSLTIVKNLVEPANPKDTFVFEIGLINMLLVDKILKIKRIKTPESDMKFFKEDEHFRKIFYEDN